MDNFSSITKSAIAYKDNGALEKALTLFDEALEIEPNNEWGYSERAEILYLLGQYDKAVESLDEAFKALKSHFPDPESVTYNPYAKVRSMYLKMANEDAWIELGKLAENKINGVTAKELHDRGKSMIVQDVEVGESDTEIHVRKDTYKVFEYTNPDNNEILYIFEKIMESLGMDDLLP